MARDPNCPFCTLPASRIIEENVHAVCIRDAYPVSPGHSLVIPRRHIRSLFEASAGEWTEFLVLLDLAKQRIDAEFSPDGYNIGINDRPAAGQQIREGITPGFERRPQVEQVAAHQPLGQDLGLGREDEGFRGHLDQAGVHALHGRGGDARFVRALRFDGGQSLGEVLELHPVDAPTLGVVREIGAVRWVFRAMVTRYSGRM